MMMISAIALAAANWGTLVSFRDPAETVGGGDDNGGLCGFFGVKLELDFHCRGAMGAPKTIILSMKKSSIGGNQY